VRLLLDTHALLWWLSDDRRLGAKARCLISDPDHDILVSVAALWEIVVKQRVGKLEADIGAIERALLADGFDRLPIAANHLATLATLPLHHRDLFDQLLIAQAIAEDATFLSDDRNAVLYPVRLQACSDP
jgi:PIN domain nuclease of toxin-antitoxin system